MTLRTASHSPEFPSPTTASISPLYTFGGAPPVTPPSAVVDASPRPNTAPERGFTMKLEKLSEDAAHRPWTSLPHTPDYDEDEAGVIVQNVSRT